VTAERRAGEGRLRSFVAVDLETTGLEPSADRIIEVGAVRVEGGVVRDRFSSLVNPGCQIPPDVTFLTGIADADVADAPTIEDVLPKVIEFIGGDPVVAHSAPFDLGFLNAAAAGRPGLLAGRGGVIDTLALSRAVLPRLPNHRLPTLAVFFDHAVERSHRAADDAEAAAAVLLGLLGLLDRTGSAVLATMAALADAGLRPLIEAARERTEGRLDPFALPDHGEKASWLVRYDNARGLDAGQRTPSEERVPIDFDALDGLFAHGGSVASRLSGYEERREQLEMMRAAGEALNSSTHLVVEAGTGVGKSLAYLIPAIHFAVANGRRVVVSTNTKNLQEQLFFKDLPFLEQCLPVRFGAALLKGRGNYLCLERWRQVLARGLSPSERAELLPVVVWQRETASGDISENVAFRGQGYLWSRISADGPCLGSRCPSSDACYLLKARRASQAAHVAVVNHSLLFSDTEAENRVLGEYAFLVCDEAHNLERVATEHLGRRASVWRARSVLDNLYRKDGADNGDLARLLDALDAAGEAGILSPVREAADRLAADVTQAAGRADAVFRALSSRYASLADRRGIEFGSLRVKRDRSVAALLGDVLPGCLAALRGVAGSAADLSDLLADAELPAAESHAQALGFHAGRAGELADDLAFLAEAADDASVFWLEARSARDAVECELRSAPVSVSQAMGDFLYSKMESIVLTSATLTVDGSFGFFMERLGLDRIPESRIRTLNVGSPYDYDSQSLVVVASYLPPPSSPGFNHKVSELVVKLGSAPRGGTLVLFTSRSSLDAVFKAVRDPLTARGRLALGQGHGPGPTALLEQFTKDEGSVLLATASFWEGVDVPGRSLEQLVIVKLPFPVPSDPIVEAHCERYDAEGEDSFHRYMVPRTAIRLRQGFGRLIRSSTDAGVVVFLDSRLATKSYGARLLDELPTRVVFAESEQELLSAVARMHGESDDGGPGAREGRAKARAGAAGRR